MQFKYQVIIDDSKKNPAVQLCLHAQFNKYNYQPKIILYLFFLLSHIFYYSCKYNIALYSPELKEYILRANEIKIYFHIFLPPEYFF